MERKRTASSTLAALQPARKKTECFGTEANGPKPETCNLPPKQRRGGRPSKKDGATSMKASKSKIQSMVRFQADNTRLLSGTARCNACLEAGRHCSWGHPEVAIPACLATTQVLRNAHEVYMTAVENFKSHEARQKMRGKYTKPMTYEELAAPREAMHGNEFGKLIVYLHGNADPLVWHTLNYMFRISQDPRINIKERHVHQQIFRVWILAHAFMLSRRVSWEEWEQALLQVYETLSLLILQKTLHSELLFYRALFLWTLFPPMTRGTGRDLLWLPLIELVEMYKEMLPRQRGPRLPPSWRMAKMATRQAVKRRLAFASDSSHSHGQLLRYALAEFEKKRTFIEERH